MATICIERNSELMNRARKFKVVIDNKEVGSIKNGDVLKFNVGPGSHALKASIDWCSSPEINVDIADGETKYYRVGGFRHGQVFMILFATVLLVHLAIKYTLHFNYTILLVLPLALIPFYYISLGRNKYLTLTDDN